MQASIVKEEVIYGEGPKMHGLIAYDPTKKEKVPGILVVHEGLGTGSYSRGRAVQLAEFGYVGFALDMYGEGKLHCSVDDAMVVQNEHFKCFDTAKKRFVAALETLKQNEHCDPNNIAAIGYCYGGVIVLNALRAGVELKGVASFHGGLDALVKPEKGKVKGKALICHGEADPIVPMEKVEAIKAEFEEAGIQYKYVGYPDIKHSFTNPEADAIAEKNNMTAALGYSEKADKESWLELQEFLKDIFTN